MVCNLRFFGQTSTSRSHGSDSECLTSETLTIHVRHGAAALRESFLLCPIWNATLARLLFVKTAPPPVGTHVASAHLGGVCD